MHIWSISSALRSQNQKNIYCIFRILSDLHVNKQRKVDEDIDRDTEVKTNLLYKFHWSFQYLLVLENISAYQGKIVSFVTLSFWSLMLQVFTMLWNNLQFTYEWAWVVFWNLKIWRWKYIFWSWNFKTIKNIKFTCVYKT